MDWEPGRWYRVMYLDSNEEWSLWCETSDKNEAYRHALKCPSAPRIQRVWARTQEEWRDV